jgi:WD40 repeat protein
MGSRRSNATTPETAEDTSDGGFQKLRVPVVQIVQVGALVLSVVTFAMAMAALPTAGALAFSSDGRKLLGTVNGYGWPMPRGMVKVWDAATGKELGSFAGSGAWVRAIAVSPDGSTLAVAHDTPVIELWDLRQGTETSSLAGHKASVMAVRFSPAGAILISASADGEVRLWDVANRRAQLTFDIGDHGLPGLILRLYVGEAAGDI